MENISFMLYCFDLARRSRGANLSNPMVGAVLEYNGKLIGQGYHESFGGPHAEINALHSVSKENRPCIPQSTLYVSLEPCSHVGKTPPCADAIIQHGIKKVIIGCPDPNPVVSGRGIQKLKSAGIEVILSKKSEEARALIMPFMAHLEKRPYIILKCVKSRDHFMGKKGEKIWLSNHASTTLSHFWRSQIDGILVGKNTVLSDNPALTVRHVSGDNPIRIVMDPTLSCPSEAAVFNAPGKVVILNNLKEEITENLTFLMMDQGDGYLKKTMTKLFDMGIYTLLVEGGAMTISHFLQENLWDEARVIDTPHVLGEGVAAPNIEGRLFEKIQLLDNTLTVIHRGFTPLPT